MKHINLLTSYNKGNEHYLLEIQDAPAWRVIRGNLYHWWDMRSYKWRVMKKVIGPLSERIHPQSWNSKELKDSKIPWDVRQDLRCYEWNRHPVVFMTEITKEEFEALAND